MAPEEQKFCMTNSLFREQPLRFSLLLLFVCLLASRSYAQNPGVAQDTAQMARGPTAVGEPTVTTTGVDDTTHVVTSPNDADLGEQQILKRADSYQPFSASVSVPFYWTSNIALTNSGEQSDFLVSPVAAIAYQPRITKTLYANIGVREQLFYYDRITSFDFGSLDVEVGLTYTIPQLHELVLHAGYDYNRLTNKNSFSSFFSNHVLGVSAEMPFHLSRAQQLSLGADANFSLTGDPNGPRRHDFETYLGYSVQLTRALFMSASARVVLHDYVLTDRVDVSEILAMSATYSVTKFLSANALGSLAANQSNHSVFDYQVGNIGGAVSLSLRF
jgi:hypothetical protein